MEKELKNTNICPFCNGDLEEQDQYTTDYLNTIFLMKCSDCGKEIKVYSKYFYEVD